MNDEWMNEEDEWRRWMNEEDECELTGLFLIYIWFYIGEELIISIFWRVVES